MKALSIRQPWAWLILNAGKYIENRDWYTYYRGPLLIHAAKGMTHRQYDDVCEFALKIQPKLIVPAFDKLERGGIVGQVEMVDCVTGSLSPWFMGAYGFVFSQPRRIRFTPLTGQQRLFNVPVSIIANLLIEY